jgi:hypothetical protein
MDTPELCRCLHAAHYSDMPKEEFDMKFIGRPDHDDLDKAAVRGKDSLELQDIDPAIKPAVKMTLDEFREAEIPPENPFLSLGNGIVYVFAKNAIDVKSAIEAILSGNDSQILGYPERGECDCCVTKNGEVVDDLPTMHMHARNKNIIWGASGSKEDLQQRAAKISNAIKKHRGTGA